MLKKSLILTLGLVLILGTAAMAKGELKGSRIGEVLPIEQPQTTLDYCLLTKTCNIPGYYNPGLVTGDRAITYYDPWAVCPAPTYPLEITTLWITLYDDGALPFPVQVDFVVYDMLIPGDPCAGPGAELCRETFICDAATYEYPTVGPLTYSTPCCVNGPVYIGIEYSDPGGSLPSFLMDEPLICPPVPCEHWAYSGGTWYMWSSYYSGGAPLFWVDTETNSPNCQDGDCANHKMHFPQLPDPNGWDVNATAPISLADDWQCTETGQLEDIHWWGSWRHDDIGQLRGFWITIHDNIPVGPNGWSVPGQIVCPPMYILEGEYTTTLMDPSPQGWYDPVQGEIIPGDHQQYFRYDYFLPEPCVQTVGQIYWLRISADVVDPVNTHWGWKSTQDHWMDDAVWGPDPDAPLPPDLWTEIYEPGGGGGPVVNSFWVGMDQSGQLVPGMSGGTDYYNGPGGINGWFWYPSGWWNIWFYNDPLDLTRYKEISIMGSVWKLDPGAPAWVEIAINWSGPEWPPGEPPPTEPTDEIHIERFPVVMSDLPNGYEIFEFFGFLIEEYNPEWVSVDVRGFNFVIWDNEPGIIEHECLPSGQQSLDLSFCITSEPVQETGACCWPDGLCTMETQSICEDNGGVFYPGLNCVDVDCPVQEDPVYDLWETPEGYNTFVNLGCGESTLPIPADFFGPGSDPFAGTIALEGEPLATNGNLGPTDTIIKRSRVANLPQCPSQDHNIDIEIVALSLVSSQPITVTYNGGQNPEAWDVKVCLSESRGQPTGGMNFDRVCEEGGTFFAYVPVVPKIVFTRVSDALEYYVDYGDYGIPAIDLMNIEDGHWMFSDPGFGVYTSSVGDLVSNCDDIPDIPIGPSAVDLIPGLQAIPCVQCAEPAVNHSIPITSLVEPAGCAQHDIWPPHDVVEAIPTLSEWGMIILGLMLLTAGTIAIVRRRKTALTRAN